MATQITAATPLVVPATAQQTYPNVWISQLGINSPNPANTTANIVTVPYYLDSNNNFVPAPTGKLNYNIQNLFALEASDTAVAAAFSAVFAVVQSWQTTLPAGVTVRQMN